MIIIHHITCSANQLSPFRAHTGHKAGHKSLIHSAALSPSQTQNRREASFQFTQRFNAPRWLFSRKAFLIVWKGCLKGLASHWHISHGRKTNARCRTLSSDETNTHSSTQGQENKCGWQRLNGLSVSVCRHTDGQRRRLKCCLAVTGIGLCGEMHVNSFL